MKLTWFGNSTFRIHIGGQIAVVDVEAAPEGVERHELTSGADLLIPDFGRALPAIEPATWAPRKPVRLLDEIDGPGASVATWRAGDGCIVLDAPDEAPLLLLRERNVPAFGRWMEQSVVVLIGLDLAERTMRLQDSAQPRLVALAGDSAAVDATFDHVGNRLSGMGLIALEPGLAVEA